MMMLIAERRIALVIVAAAPIVAGPCLAPVTAAGDEPVCATTETRRVLSQNPSRFARFGDAVALHGDRLVIGAERDDVGADDAGAVEIFDWDGAAWIPSDTIRAPIPVEDEYFGRAVAFAGDTLVVGSPDADDACPTDPDCDSGRVDVFRFGVDGWRHEAVLDPPGGPVAGDRAGLDVAILGDRIAVSVSGANAGTGAVHLFVNTDGKWGHETTLHPPAGIVNAAFGRWIDLDGDRLAVGAPIWVPDDGLVGSATGLAFVYRHDPGDGWIREITLFPPVIHTNGFFGTDVRLDGDALVVGEWGAPDIGTGAAHVYRRIGAAWSLEQTLLDPGGDMFDNFGNACAIDGDRIVIGAYGDDAPAGSASGSLLVFERLAGTWTPLARLTADAPVTFDRLGRPIALDGGRLAAGAVGMGSEFGAVLVYEGVTSDCNDNAVIDLCDVASGSSPDADGNGRPDECDCPSDLDGDGATGFSDLLALLAAWGPCPECPEDLDADDVVGFMDLITLLAAWGPCAG